MGQHFMTFIHASY